MKPMVLHARASNFVGGPEKQILGHIRASSRFRHAVVTFEEGRAENPLLQACLERGIPVSAVHAKGPWDLGAVRRFRDEVIHVSPDILCTHGYKPTVLSVLGGLPRRLIVIAFSRGETGESRRVRLYEWAEVRVLARVERVVCVSRAQRARLARRGVRQETSHLVYNAIDADDFANHDHNAAIEVRSELGFSSCVHLVAAAGRLSPEKGHRYLVEAVAELGSDGPEAVFAFCGDGVCRRELESLADRLGVAGRCRFLGFRHDLKRIFHAMDLLVLPSLTEGLPNVILEAFACAKPVVATAVGGVPEIVEDGVNGVLVPPRRPDLLARAIRSCLADPQRLRAMGARGREKVRSEFTFEKQAERLEAIYDEVLARHGRLRASESG